MHWRVLPHTETTNTRTCINGAKDTRKAGLIIILGLQERAGAILGKVVSGEEGRKQQGSFVPSLEVMGTLAAAYMDARYKWSGNIGNYQNNCLVL